VRYLAAFFLMFLAGCQTTGSTVRDELGNTYPEICRGPVTCEKEICKMAGQSVWIKPVPRNEMPPPNDPTDSKLYGRHYGGGMAIIDASLTGYSRDDTIRHEMCHAVAGKWHR
jgi:hypothetical protein